MFEAIQIARQIPPGSPAFQAALDVCALRGVQPFAPYGGDPTITNWQATIAEHLVIMKLQDILRMQGL